MNGNQQRDLAGNSGAGTLALDLGAMSLLAALVHEGGAALAQLPGQSVGDLVEGQHKGHSPDSSA